MDKAAPVRLPVFVASGEVLLCCCADCEGNVPVWRSHLPEAAAPLSLVAACQGCRQVWSVLEMTDHEVTAYRDGPRWRIEGGLPASHGERPS